MKYNKGMWLDGKPSQNPVDTTRINKNVVFDRSKGAITNELGTQLIESYGGDKQLVGIITLDSNDFLVFSRKLSGDSEIGYVSSDLKYKVLSNDNEYDLKPEYPVHGRFQRNPKGELLVVWTDGRQTHYMNINKPFNSRTTPLFYTGIRPTISNLTVMSGGSLKSGGYHLLLSFEKHDYSTTDWFRDYNPVVITNASRSWGTGYNNRLPNQTTDKLIRFNVNYNNDNDVFRAIRVGYITVINGISTAHYIKTVDISPGSGFIEVVLDGNETPSPITLEEVIIDTPRYEKAQHIAQMQSTLYLAGLTEYREPSHQHKLNTLEFAFKSEMSVWGFPNHKDPYYYIDRKTFGHGEVYAIYIRFLYKWGFGRWYHVPGRLPDPGDKDSHPEDNTYLKYQLEDTCTYNYSIGEGKLSYWENRDEKYPNTGEYPEGNVRHFKFPSVRWMKENVYNSIQGYGVTFLDTLSLILKTPINLDNFKDCLGESPIRFELGYAKHTIDNGLNVGQSIVIFPADREDSNKHGQTSVGANFSWVDPEENTHTLIKDVVRTYPLEMLAEKRLLPVTHIRLESYMEAATHMSRRPDEDDKLVGGVMDYSYYLSTVKVPTQKFIKVKDSEFILNNTIKGDTNNTYLESTVRLELDKAIEGVRDVQFGSIGGTIMLWEYAIPTLLVTLLNVKNNCYFGFTNQAVIPSDATHNNGYQIYGDMYVMFNASTITYGLSPYLAGYSTDTLDEENTRHTKRTGFRFMHVHTLESLYNYNLRYENPDILGGYSIFYQGKNRVRDLVTMDGDIEPNAILQTYSTDFNVQNGLALQNIYNPSTLYTGEFPYRVIRGLTPNSDDLTFSGWTKFLDANKYELPRDKGRLVHIDNGADYLLFHFENSLLTTRPAGRLDTNGTTIFLGVGNIFEHEAVEVIHDKLGALGTRHKWSCKMTKYGYVWVDDVSGNVYLFNKNLDILSNKGLYNFFLEHGLTIGDNPFIGNGYHIVLDEISKRLIITRKHLTLKPELRNKFKGVWRSDQTFLNSLSPGDIIYKDGTFKQVK